jgi:hypothetical protein
MFAKGFPTIRLEDILSFTSELEIAEYYLKIKSLPCVIESPLREDNHPSFSVYLYNNKVKYLDYATKEKGSIFTLLCKMYNLSFREMLHMIYKDFKHRIHSGHIVSKRPNFKSLEVNNTKVECIVREWKPYDEEYWNSYGISLKWLKFADVYPISHKIITKDNIQYVFKADKLAYAFVEFKDNNTTLKIYQPYNKQFKWCNKHDKSVISLWKKIPEKGDKLCICSSLKDALCLWANIGIPAISLQGEGYNMSQTAIDNLKSRYKDIYIMLDNDSAGLLNAKNLADKTGFINVVLPDYNAKDISDLYKVTSKNQFINILKPLFYDKKRALSDNQGE